MCEFLFCPSCFAPDEPLCLAPQRTLFANGGQFPPHSALVLVLIVVRSKLVPDFAISLHVVHLMVTWLYTGSVPRHLFWWLTMAASSACAVTLGIWGCRYRELMPISFGGNGGGASSSSLSASAANAGAGRSGNGQDGGDEEQGFSMGRGRGRGRDGGGEYEMMNMNGGNGAK